MGASDLIPVPRWAVLGSVAALSTSMLGLAFLTGRLTAPAPPPPPAPVEAPATAPLHPSATTALATPAPVTAAASPVAAPEPVTAAPAASREVSSYLAAREAALDTGRGDTDPDAVAHALVADALGGRSDAIDSLLDATRGAASRVSKLSPPEPAARLHNDTLALLDHTVRVYEALGSGVRSGDLGALAGLQTEAAALEAAARELDRETERLRAAHGGG